MENNKIYNMDCLEGMKNIKSGSIDLIVTDPPYRTTSRGSAGNSGGMLQKEINKSGKVFKHNDINIKDYANELFRVLKDGSHLYIMTNHVNLKSFLDELEKAGFSFIKSLIWDKGNKITGQYYMSQFEYILFFRKGKGVKINNCGTSDIIIVKNKKTKINGKNAHDTEKPVKLMEILIENSSKENQVVLDPFMGYGATAIACLNTNRNYIGFEIDTHYYKLSEQRLENYKIQESIVG